MISGTYAVSMTMPTGLQKGTLTLAETDGQLSGTLKTNDIVSSFSGGRVYGDHFTFSGAIRKLLFKISYTASGEVHGNKLSIDADTRHGVFTITGTRV